MQATGMSLIPSAADGLRLEPDLLRWSVSQEEDDGIETLTRRTRVD